MYYRTAKSTNQTRVETLGQLRPLCSPQLQLFVSTDIQPTQFGLTLKLSSSTVVCAMRTMQLLLRQPLRSGLTIIRPSCQRSFLSSLAPKKLSLSAQNPASRQGSICFQCRFRTQSRNYSSPSKHENETSPSKPTSELEYLQSIPETGKDFASATINNERQPATKATRLEQKQDSNTLKDGVLPSDAERRRSQLSKKFTDLMDNIQGNVFIAGQKLNDLTGYSGIEKLKQDIEMQGIFHASLFKGLFNT